jgi:hypothetical protein
MDKIMDNMFFAEPDEETRYIKIIEAAIQKRTVKQYNAFAKTRNNEKRWKKARQEALEADEHAFDLGISLQ